MKLTKSTITTALATIIIGALSIGTASAAAHETGRVYIGSHTGFELTSDSSYTNGRTAPQGSQPILKSNASGKTNGRQG